MFEVLALSSCTIEKRIYEERNQNPNYYFTERKMKSFHISLKNNDFEKYKKNQGQVNFPGWHFNPQMNTKVFHDEGFDSKTSLALIRPIEDEDNKTSTLTLGNKRKIEKFLNFIILDSSTRKVSYKLDLDYLEQKITVNYKPDIFEGDRPKSIVYFDFYNKSNTHRSRVTYVLNGLADCGVWANQIINNVSYITYIINNHKIGSWNTVEFDILKDQNDGAKKIDAIVLKPKDVSMVNISLLISCKEGNIKVIHTGWAKYINIRGIDEIKEMFNESIAELYTYINIPNKWQSKLMNFSVSGWVWSDTPISTFFKIVSDTGREAMSAYHSGNGEWEYLTVVYPFSEIVTRFQISLVTKQETARFDKIKPVVIVDDRFNIFCDNLKTLREKITYRKGNRIRIIMVGNSTVAGFGDSQNASIPYILQSKLESLFPGKFEVINYGIGGWNLQSQIISLNTVFFYKDPYHLPILPKEISSMLSSMSKTIFKKDAIVNHKQLNAATLKTLQPDIIIIGSMWNDINSTLEIRHVIEMGTYGIIPYSVLYLQSLYSYMDNPTGLNYVIAKTIYDEKYRFVLSEQEEVSKDYIVNELKESGTEILINYLPVGSEEATKFYAECALESNVGFIN